MNIKTIFVLRKILTPFIIIFFAGFIGCYKWKTFVNELHQLAAKENKNDTWFTKKVIGLYFHVVFTTFINLFAWAFLLRLIFF